MDITTGTKVFRRPEDHEGRLKTFIPTIKTTDTRITARQPLNLSQLFQTTSDYRFKRPSEKRGDRFDAENADKNPVNQCSHDFIRGLYH